MATAAVFKSWQIDFGGDNWRKTSLYFSVIFFFFLRVGEECFEKVVIYMHFITYDYINYIYKISFLS